MILILHQDMYNTNGSPRYLGSLAQDNTEPMSLAPTNCAISRQTEDFLQGGGWRSPNHRKEDQVIPVCEIKGRRRDLLGRIRQHARADVDYNRHLCLVRS